ncbi:hypothetical protein NDI45_11410 [Leptolyngbya sp. GB1-A1]|uniref:DUF6653 family protein n=1 Tax=Leptolyngbya sp. GB1-A1 TaxID=2933908 RepID=UPI003296C6C3
MTVERKIANTFHMDEETWARHANPWSVWTRFTVLPILILVIWSRVWLGWWSLVPIAIALFWMWINPRIFAKPQSTNHWASKSVLGERVWLNRDTVPVPEHHQRVPNVLSLVSVIGMAVVIWGLVTLDGCLTLLGCALVYLSKLWFLDRMVWLYEDMRQAHPQYQSWLY